MKMDKKEMVEKKIVDGCDYIPNFSGKSIHRLLEANKGLPAVLKVA